jgi:metal-dependent hydrolase (beta-lactamase superfamily II)
LVISGCDHPSIERMLSVTEKVLDLSIRAVVDGLHLERAGRTGCPFQA